MKRIFFLSLSLMIIGCKTNPDKQPHSESTISDTSLKADVSKKNNSRFSGLYTGVTLCADCEGIRQTVLFAGNKFRMEEVYIDRNNNAPNINEGSFARNDDKLILKIKDSIFRYFFIEDSSLLPLDNAGNKMEGLPAEKFRIYKKEIAESNQAWMKKKDAGVNFIGIGTEPFWSLEVRADSINLLLASDMRTVKFPYKQPIVNNEVMTYDLQSGQAQMKIVIIPGFCSDGMSDNWYEYAVNVNYNDTLYKGCGIDLKF